MHRSIVVHESTLNRKMSPAAIEVVHPDRVASSAFTALDIVGGVADVIVSASVGGKFA